MKMNFMKTVLILGLFLIIAISAQAQVQDTTNIWATFYDDASTFNGELLPVGSIVDAFDPDGINCGRFYVHTVGHYGFMIVYGDVAGEPDEGAVYGDPIKFEINGKLATIVSGDSTWDSSADPKEVELSAGSTILISAVELPNDTIISPGNTVKLKVRVQNDGDGIDFYSVTAENSHFEFIAEPQDSFSYAEPGEAVDVFFDIIVPTWVSNDDTVSVVTYSVFSNLDPTQKVDGTVTIYMSVTDAPEGPFSLLPDGFNLAQNYPNPFNPVTNISFTLPEKSSAKLEIIDILGRYVEVLDLGLKLNTMLPALPAVFISIAW